MTNPLSDSTKKALITIQDKLQAENNIAVFTAEEKLIMEAAYTEITNRTIQKNCPHCWGGVVKILRNYFIHFPTESELTERELQPVEYTIPSEPIETTDEAVEYVKPKRTRKKKDA
jgi:hypothetical protein